MKHPVTVQSSSDNKPTLLNCQHYATQHILLRVRSNDNNDLTIDDKAPPRFPDQSVADELDKLFLDGAKLIHEGHELFDDDGGECYTAYILKAGLVNAYNASGILAMKYIVEHPEYIITVWAGPY